MKLIPPAAVLTQTVKGLHHQLPATSRNVDSGDPEPVTEVSGMGCGDSNLVELSCCKLRKIYVLCESFIYTGQTRVPCCLGLVRLTGLTGLAGLAGLMGLSVIHNSTPLRMLRAPACHGGLWHGLR